MIGHTILAIILSGFIASLTDWFFGGMLFHDKYLAHPEIWRRIGPGPAENRAVAWSIVLDFVTCAAFVLTSLTFHIFGYLDAFRLATAILLMAPLPLLITNALFIKIHPLTVVAHSLGWVVKLFLAAAAVGWLLP